MSDYRSMPPLPLFGGSIPGIQLTPSAPPMVPLMPPHAAPLPAMAPRLSLMQRVRAGLGQLSDALMPPPPAGLFSPDELQAARNRGLLATGLGILNASHGTGIAAPGLGQALAQGVQAGQAAYTGELNNGIAQRAASQQIQQQSAEAQRQQEILAARKQIMAQVPPPTSGSQDEMMAWAQKVYPMFLKAGDVESAKQLGPIIERAMALKQAQAQNAQGQMAQGGGFMTTFVPGKGYVDPETGKFVPYLKRGLSDDEKQVKQQEMMLRQLAIQAGIQQHQITDAEQQSRAFASQNKMLTDASRLYISAKAAIAQARAGNRAALSPAILNFAASVDPKVQLRQGTIEFVKHIDKSYSGNFRAWLARVASSELPPEQLDMMDRLIDRVHADQAAAYERARAGRVKRNGLLDAYIPPTEEIFGTDGTVVTPEASISSPGLSPADRVRLLIPGLTPKRP